MPPLLIGPERSSGSTSSSEPTLSLPGQTSERGDPSRVAWIGHGWRWWLIEGLFCLALAIASTWPLALHLTDRLPLGTEAAATVPLFNLWTVWWNCDRAAHSGEQYWHAPIFAPAGDAFAFSEPQPTLMLMSPIVAIWGRAAGYNLYLLLALTLNGWATCRLLRAVGAALSTQLAAAAMMILLPFVHWQLGVLQLVPLFAEIWTLHCLFKLKQSPSVWWGLGLGISAGLCYWICANLGLFWALLLSVGGLVYVSHRLLKPRVIGAVLVAAAVAASMLAPIVAAQWRVKQQHRFDRSIELMAQLSAAPADYTVSPFPALMPWRDLSDDVRRRWWMMSPGGLKAILAGIGLLAFGCRSLRLPLLCLWLMGGLAFVLSLGPGATTGDVSQLSKWDLAWQAQPAYSAVLYRLLIGYVPGFGQVRNVFRFSIFVQLIVVLLAAAGLESLRWLGQGSAAWFMRRRAVRCGERSAEAGHTTDRNDIPALGATVPHPQANPGVSRGISLAVSLVVTLIGFTAAGEIRPPSQRLYRVLSEQSQLGWLNWLRNETPENAVILCLPYVSGENVEDYYYTTVWMYWGTWHERRLVNGYSGFFPEQAMQMKERLKRFPEWDSIQAIRETGTTHVVIHRSAWRRDWLFRNPLARYALEWKYGDDQADVDIYLWRKQEPAAE